MNKRGFIEEMNPFAVLLGILGGFFAFWITGNPFGTGGEDALVNSVSMFWRLASGLAAAIVGFLIVTGMAE